jgi:hypothetical protein
MTQRNLTGAVRRHVAMLLLGGCAFYVSAADLRREGPRNAR